MVITARRGRENAVAQITPPAWFSLLERASYLPKWGLYACATVLVVATFLVRYSLIGDAHGYHFIFFVLPVLLSSLFLSEGAGILALVLSTVLIKLFLIPDASLFGFASYEDSLALLIFVATGTATVLSSAALHRAFFRLAEAKQKVETAYDQVAASDQEKEVLLHDLAHRFKNDLANLTAILRLQARGVADPAARTELIAASERVHIIGRLHQRLTRAGEAAVVEIREFLTSLCADLGAAMIGTRPITISAEADVEEFPLADAITIGLIVNELITNSLKYAFPGGRPGTIGVRLERHGRKYELTVTDDGVGFAPPTGESSGLGQKLIQSLALQLGGEYQVEIDKGGRIGRVRFPAVHAKDQAMESTRPGRSRQ